MVVQGTVSASLFRRLYSSKSVTTRISNMLIDKVGTKAVCVGRNYEKHAKEMGAQVTSTKGDPILFIKPTSSYIRGDSPILLPVGAQVHHEVELGVVIGKRAKLVSVDEAIGFVAGYVCCIDVTARNWQAKAKSEGTPWTISKGCDTFLPMSDLIPAQKVPNPRNLDLWLKVNGNMKQSGNTKDMIFSIEELISYTSKFMTLYEGDLLLTGTPEGVGPLEDNDIVEAGLGELTSIKFSCQRMSS
ncbi:5-oxopent-3-ene-1,2,5-tricarboxylate decarboxylase [Galdieria sulphuraria]|uniref:5-oxopent-3-ene-1,2,5-tricarboxylate decarboxylase n=1 Tax=Galdieria sulphuraria TaxID=130081 RepID=M2Y2A4_GALSU|nr:5-oxopent-3-ene-1,2,5-tricarboxylate decarboxylase [Galdieria sulphuraria]EME29939.1 5-oxopent-3-ene-1,2,5-tricarboxylate decarboxylase [Galdieria sulphuraria]|eukprot:XP_005706459.1 5-oxopent-3-ene-1,2,5-tricarboxylate decarboxylase [Galdieria sulphuraria]